MLAASWYLLNPVARQRRQRARAAGAFRAMLLFALGVQPGMAVPGRIASCRNEHRFP
jgi:hypothetical protein